MKQPYGAKLCRSCMRSTPWIAVSHKKDCAVEGFAISQITWIDPFRLSGGAAQKSVPGDREDADGLVADLRLVSSKRCT